MTDREFQVWLAVYLKYLERQYILIQIPSHQESAKEANQAVWELRAAETTLSRTMESADDA